MDSADTGNLIYFVVLLGAILFWFVIQNRTQIGKVMQQAAIWALIFIGAIAVYGMWDDIRSTITPQQAVFTSGNRIEVPRSPDGHYYLTLQVNNVETRFVVDTGASMVVLTRADAKAAGIDTDELAFLGEAMTANGMVKTAPVRLDSIGVEGLKEARFRAWVNGGDMDQSLLGMTYLQQFEKIEISNGKLVLTR